MFYAIRHATRYRYDAPVRESVMQLIVQPKSEGAQRLHSFQVVTRPRGNLQAFSDHYGNAVYHFSIPGEHKDLMIEVDSTVDIMAQPAPPEWVDNSVWNVLATDAVVSENFDMLHPTRLTHPSPLLDEFLQTREISAFGDPMTALRRLSRALYDSFAYTPSITEVDSPIDVALRNGKGVCQDFAHIMLTIARQWGVPARYVSGYLFTKRETGDRSDPEATHAWVEAYIPGVGWTGFDPTNNVMAGERHIRVATGRDYRDVPPTRGVFKGPANSELSVAVAVTPSAAPKQKDDFLRVVRPMSETVKDAALITALDHQQQQQQ